MVNGNDGNVIRDRNVIDDRYDTGFKMGYKVKIKSKIVPTMMIARDFKRKWSKFKLKNRAKFKQWRVLQAGKCA